MPVEGAFGEPAAVCEETVCPRCGESWVRWRGSRLLCHARCVLTVEEVDALLVEYRSVVRGGQGRLAEKYGIPKTVLVALFALAEKRRRS